jgi:hypothetical protein
MNDWQAAYSTIAEAAATLTGLLFVSVSVKLNLASAEERRWMLLVSKRSFLDFIAVLAIALLFLVPAISRDVIGWAVLWLGGARTAWHVSHWRERPNLSAINLTLRDYVAPMAITLGLLITGAVMLLGWQIAWKLVYVMSVVLLLGACQNAWHLLTR